MEANNSNSFCGVVADDGGGGIQQVRVKLKELGTVLWHMRAC